MVRAKQYERGDNTPLEFPGREELVNFTVSDPETPPAEARVPQEFLQEILDQEDQGIPPLAI